MLNLTPDTSLRLRLRNETSDAHLAAEKTLDIFRTSLDVKAYIQILKPFYAFHRSFERAIDNLPPSHPVRIFYGPRRRKTPLLLLDFNFFGLTAFAESESMKFVPNPW